MNCTECGEDGADRLRHDAADEEHWFHEGCWLELVAWLRGHEGDRGVRCASTKCLDCRGKQ